MTTTICQESSSATESEALALDNEEDGLISVTHNGTGLAFGVAAWGDVEEVEIENEGTIEVIRGKQVLTGNDAVPNRALC